MAQSMLLAEYATGRSPEAFRLLVEQYLDLVYASARRQLRDAHLAEDAAQAVFVLLAQKANRIPTDRPLSAWLLTTTRYVVANLQREIACRKRHERRAAAMKTETTSGPDDSRAWDEVSPFLDEGLESLRESDRDVLLLRFFESQSLRQTGEALGISEDAVEKRISRAIDRLRDFLSRKGVSVAATSLSIGLSQRLLLETPHGLASTIVQGGQGANAISLKLLATKTKATMMTATKIKMGACAVPGLMAAGTGVAIIRHAGVNASPATRPVAQAAVAMPRPTSDELYRPNPDEPLRVVRNAPASVRQEMWTRLQSPQKPSPSGKMPVFATPSGPFAFDWNQGKPQGPVAYASGQQLPLDRIITNLVVATTSLEPFEIELPAGFPIQLHDIPGDIVYTKTLPTDKALAGLESAIRRELGVPLKLSLQDGIERKVFVLRGTFQYKPLPVTQTNGLSMPNGQPVTVIELYGGDVLDPKDRVFGSAMMSTPLFADQVAGPWLARGISSWIGDREIVVEANGFPGAIGWREHIPKTDTPDSERTAHDPAQVLTHVCEQTGLTWSEETRRVQRLIVSLDPAK